LPPLKWRRHTPARELCQQVGEAPQLFSALWGIWYFYAVRPEEQKAVELAQQLFTLAHRVRASTLLMIAHRALGANSMGLGELAQGLEHLRHAMALYDPPQHRALAFVYGQDIGVICQQWSAWALWLLGYPDQALTIMREALQMAHESAHPLTLAYVMTHSAYFHQFRRERARVHALAERALADADALHALLTEAGFRDVAMRTATPTVRMPSPQAYVQIQLTATPLATVASDLDGHHPRRARAGGRLRPAILCGGSRPRLPAGRPCRGGTPLSPQAGATTVHVIRTRQRKTG
jgi:tetratricopeptide (TPR) repeat protein